MEMQVPGKDMAYETPQCEVIEFHAERRFLTESVTDYSGNYHLEDGGLNSGGPI